ncbi:hypothetical protein ES703_72221 [subsurface metagenome]
MNTQPKNKPLEPIMPYPKCPHCGSSQILDDETYKYYKGSITCFDCKGRYYVEFGDSANAPSLSGRTLLSEPRPIGDPELMKGLTVPAIPNPLYSVYEEAVLALAVGIPKGAALLCRYVVQQALLLKGIPDQNPQNMVNVARNKKLLSELATKQCSATVFMGGKAGHPQTNWVENIGPNDAKQALLVTRRILLELFNPSSLNV